MTLGASVSTSRKPLIVAALALLSLPAAASANPVELPAVTKGGTAAQPSATYRAPMSGFLNVRLRGRGDWDLLVPGVGASKSFGGSELVQTWVRAGDRIVARAQRRAGASRGATVSFGLVDVAPPKLTGTPKLVRVEGSRTQLANLENLGLDVTESRGFGWADVVLTSPSQLATLQKSGLKFTTRITDLQAAYVA